MARLLTSKKTSQTWKLPDIFGQTVLHLAAKKRDRLIDLPSDACLVDVVSQLGADPKWQDFRGQTALHIAVKFLRPYSLDHRDPVVEAVSRRLVEMGVPLEARDVRGETALQIASRKRFTAVGVIKTLVHAGAAPNFECLQKATRSDESTLADHLMKLASSLGIIDQHGNSCLHLAARDCDEDLVAALLEAGSPTNCLNLFGRTPLMEAEAVIMRIEPPGRSRVLSLLRAADSRPGDELETPVDQAIRDLGAEQGPDRDSPINAQDGMGRTRLHLAVLSGNLSMAERLVAARADLGLADHMGRTPLHLAALRGNLKACRLLVKEGAALWPDNHGETPLHAAATWEYSRVAKANVSRAHARICRLLLQNDGAVHRLWAQNTRGETALHFAAAFRT